LSPKVAVFFLAFLPQFVDADAPSKVAAFITLGLVFNATGTAWNIAVAWFAGIVGRSTGYARAKVWLERAISVLFLGIGVKLAFAERPEVFLYCGSSVGDDAFGSDSAAPTTSPERVCAPGNSISLDSFLMYTGS
jgi:hypothetical protein